MWQIWVHLDGKNDWFLPNLLGFLAKKVRSAEWRFLRNEMQYITWKTGASLTNKLFVGMRGVVPVQKVPKYKDFFVCVFMGFIGLFIGVSSECS